MKVVLALQLLSVASAKFALDDLQVMMEADVRKYESDNWVVGERVSEEDTLNLDFYLKQDEDDQKNFEKELLELASPVLNGEKNPKYGKWLSHEEVVEKLSASREAIDSVLDFAANQLQAQDIHINKLKSIVKVKNVKARIVEEALSTRLHHHSHKTYTKVDLIRATAPYHLPARVAVHVSLVGELIRFPRMRFADSRLVFTDLKEPSVNKSSSDSWSKCGSRYSSYTNPYVLAERYGFDLSYTSSSSDSSLALGEFQGEYYDDTDLEAFSSACDLPTISISSTTGGNTPSKCEVGLEPCIESLLDIEYAGAIAGDIPLSIIYSSSYSLLDFAESIQDMDDPPKVVSVSYGNDEAQQTGSSFMESVSSAFMKLGSMGVTILFAAGDQGVWGREGYGTSFNPDFPAGSPYVTAVGGTDFATESTIGDETTWEDGGSGFSDEFDTASFQTDEVSAYLKTDDLPKSSLYNADGRAYPDVSALAGEVNPYLISYKDGTFSAVAGTSAACPVVAGMLAQINDKRLAAGKSALGWVNPALYAAGEAGSGFYDVTSGTTDGGYTTGFTAEEGWDAATGWGTVDFTSLESYLSSY
uniref:subtilisin n=1 Tax=Aureoumbra lagunensis TaxID=44058 RepID=A0A7S3JSF3_9STRA|mmetsp:Transcript_10512/g.15879  ORF Transcript_10512/g.15879 Transcript_10512/m.15879 type:complete len:587 (-) Transcript_10512:2248-4008(-)